MFRLNDVPGSALSGRTLTLPPCSMAAELEGSGVGSCQGVVPATYFPEQGGTATATATLNVYLG